MARSVVDVFLTSQLDRRSEIHGRGTMGRKLASALALCVALLAAMVLNDPAMAQTPEQKIWTLLGDSEAPYVSLGEADFRALGAGFDLPDGGKAITALAERAPGGAFDPRDVAKLSPQQLGYKAGWASRASIPRRRTIRGSSS